MEENQLPVSQRVVVTTSIGLIAKQNLKNRGIGIGRAGELYLEMKEKEEQESQWKQKFENITKIAKEYATKVSELEQKIKEMENDKNGNSTKTK